MSTPAPGPAEPGLARRLGTGDAVVVGLSAMLGAGVFAAFAPAARSAGSALLLALLIAAVVALCNAVASAQLAQTYPSSGGTYVFGRAVLGEWWGFAAGWAFVVGKTASCAAMAMTFAVYAIPGVPWAQRLVAVLAVLALTLATLRGITRTALVARVLLALTLATLLLVLALTGARTVTVGPVWPAPTGGVLGVLQASGLLFFAFAGYARIATLAEEVRRPSMIGRAVLISLGTVVVLYLLIGAALLAVLGADVGVTPTPLAAAVERAGAPWAVPVVRVGAAAASLGALLALLAGVSRTTLAMAREADLPRSLAAVDPRHQVPARAQLAIGALVVALVLVGDLREVIGFSSVGVLVYYLVANLSALRQPRAERRWPRVLNVVGGAGCVLLVLTLPPLSVVVGLAVIALGLVGRLLLRRPDGTGVRVG